MNFKRKEVTRRLKLNAKRRKLDAQCARRVRRACNVCLADVI
jgi:hypothetical protein